MSNALTAIVSNAKSALTLRCQINGGGGDFPKINRQGGLNKWGGDFSKT